MFGITCLSSSSSALLNAGMVMSHLEVDVLGELGNSLKFLLGFPQLVLEVSPTEAVACRFSAGESM